jgi:hypothetical protein
MRFSLRLALSMMTMVAVECFVLTITPPGVIVPAVIAAAFVGPGFLLMVESCLLDRSSKWRKAK